MEIFIELTHIHGGKEFVLNTSCIVMMERSSGNYCYIYTDKTHYHVRESLEEIIELTKGFIVLTSVEKDKIFAINTSRIITIEQVADGGCNVNTNDDEYHVAESKSEIIELIKAAQ